jgi:hypothetical protein
VRNERRKSAVFAPARDRNHAVACVQAENDGIAELSEHLLRPLRFLRGFRPDNATLHACLEYSIDGFSRRAGRRRFEPESSSLRDVFDDLEVGGKSVACAIQIDDVQACRAFAFKLLRHRDGIFAVDGFVRVIALIKDARICRFVNQLLE